MVVAAKTNTQSLIVNGENPNNLFMKGTYITVNVNPIEITIDHNIVLLLQKFLLKSES
jgi:hypothetical protein